MLEPKINQTKIIVEDVDENENKIENKIENKQKEDRFKDIKISL